MTEPFSRIPQVKVCGLTDPDQAIAAANQGVDAVGFVFFPKSPRHMTLQAARTVCQVLSPTVRRVGVFVDKAYSGIMEVVDACGLDVVQLHGQEPPELIHQLRRQGLLVIKALFVARYPGLSDADKYAPSGFLVECGAGKLPGGNAETWNWAQAKSLSDRYPLILAGGLTPENIVRAIGLAQPDAVDVSSGVESSPGNKNLTKLTALMLAIRQCRMERLPRKIF